MKEISQYDNFGNLRKAWDANGDLTQTDYSSSYAYADPTSVTTQRTLFYLPKYARAAVTSA